MNCLKKISIALSAMLVCLALFAVSAFSQQITATISGTITDPAGAVVAGATVAATSVETGLAKTALTNDDGNYTITFLPPGSYNITVNKTGFEQITRENIKLEVAQTASIDITLGVTAGQVTVEVEGNETPLLQTETSNLETTIEQKLIEDLPTPDRNIFAFVNLVPGTIDTGAALGTPSTQIGSSANRNFFDSNFAVNGGRASTNDVLLDGITNTIGDFNGVTISPPQDAVREFKVVSGVAPAEYGRTGGGIVTISSKSGTRKFHGALYEYYQDGNLNANGFFNNRNNIPRVNQLSRHQFGGAIGGPVYIPSFGEGTPAYVRRLKRTFFFFNYELRREQNPFTRLLTLPTAKMRTGDLSELLNGTVRTGLTNPDGSPALFGQIYNPFTPLVGGRRTPIAGNNLSVLLVCSTSRARTTACLDPVALAVLQYLPLPNRPGLVDNYLVNDTVDFNRDIVSGRIDHTLSERQNFFVRYSYEKRLNAPPNFFDSPATSGNLTNDRFYNGTVNHVYSITPNIINNLRVGFTRAHAITAPAGLGFDPTSLGLPAYLRDAAPILVFPVFNIGSVAPGQTGQAGEITTGQIGGGGNNQARDTHNISDSVTWVSGSHTVRTGGEYRLYKFYPFQASQSTPTGSYTFSRDPTRGPTPTAGTPVESTGSSLASFLLGIPSQVSQEIVRPITIYHHYGAAYAQDDWKIFRNLTLNLGLRWDFETPTANKQQLVSSFDFEGASPLQGRLNLTNLDPAVAALNPDIRNLPGLLSFPEGAQTKTNFDRFAPRVGFAYSINNKTTVRGGFGMFFLPISLEASTATGTNITSPQTQTNLNTQVTASTIFLSDPFTNPGLRLPTGNSLGANTSLGQTLGFVVEPKRPNPYVMQWNLVVQRELAKNLVLDVAYVGNAGRHLPSRDVALNQISSATIDFARAEVAAGRATSIESFFETCVPNPFAGLFPTMVASTCATPAAFGVNGSSTTGNLNSPTIARAQLLRRFPQYTAVGLFSPHIGYSNYHALQINLQKRFSNGFSLLSNYVWSKLLDTGGGGNGVRFTDPTNAEDASNYDEEYSYSTLDVPHRVTASFTYELPFGKGKYFGGDWNGLTNALLGGWQVSGTGVYQKGAPITITYQGFQLTGGLAAVGNLQRRPNRVGSVNPLAGNYGDRVRQGLSVFNPDAFTGPSEANFEFGGARTYNDIRRDNHKNIDLSIIKNVSFSEGRQKIQVRAEFLNALNLVVFAAPPSNQFAIGSATFGQVTGQGNRPRSIQLVGRFTF
jgi:hypothetical protein